VIRSSRVLALLAVMTAPASVQAVDDYEPTDGGFRIHFPGKPKESSQKAKSAIGELKVSTATYATSDGNVYLVSYTDFPAGTAKSDMSAAFFDGVRRGLAGKDGKLLGEKDIQIGPDQLPGRDIDIEKDKKRMKFRVVLRDGRLYQVAAIGTASFVKSKDTTAFIDSFKLTK
jgi:hypothetical protein